MKAPLAKQVSLGYVDAFDPDVFVQHAKEVPIYLRELRREIIKPDDIWEPLEAGGGLSPKFGLGIFELLKDVFEEHFKYKSKYPVRVVQPRIPTELALFWSSLFGEIPPKPQALIEKHYREPLEIEVVDVLPEKLLELLRGNVLFPRRIGQLGLKHFNRSGFRRDAYVYFLDAAKVEDVVDFWNLRAMGKQVLPVPKQLKDDPHLKEIVIEYLKDNRRPWRHNPTVCDTATIMQARSCTMDEVQEYAKTIKIDPLPIDKSKDPFFALQRWYPRVWDEWARDKDGALPDDVYGEEESSTDVNNTQELTFRFKPLLPKFATERGYHGEPRCAVASALGGGRRLRMADYVARTGPTDEASAAERRRRMLMLATLPTGARTPEASRRI